MILQALCETEVVVERVVERLRLPSCRKTDRATAAAARPKQAPGLCTSPSHTGWDTGSSDINRLAIYHHLREPSLPTNSNRIIAYHTIWYEICHTKGYSSALIKGEIWGVIVKLKLFYKSLAHLNFLQQSFFWMSFDLGHRRRFENKDGFFEWIHFACSTILHHWSGWQQLFLQAQAPACLVAPQKKHRWVQTAGSSTPLFSI